MICFEDVFAYLSRKAANSGAELLINQTNDAWFDGSGGPEQHLSHCVFRAVENRVPVVRSANTGVSCYIDYVGRIDAFALEDGRRTGFAGTRGFRVPILTADQDLTLYRRYGDIVLGIPCACVTIAFFVLVMINKRRKHADQARKQETDNSPE